MRVLWSSNAPWVGSGYGVQTQAVLPRLAGLREVGGMGNVAVCAWYGLQGGVLEWPTAAGPLRVLPGVGDAFGNDVIGHHARRFEADVVVTLIDVWTQKETARKVRPARWAPWFPVDCEPVPPRVLEALEGAWPVVYSRWGQEMLEAAGVAAAYVPHGVEPGVMRVLGAGDGFDREAARVALVGPGCEHLTVMVAANTGFPDRKWFQGQLRAWAEFAEGDPGCRLYVHALAETDAGGVDLRRLVGVLGIAERVFFPDAYAYMMGLPAEYLAWVYNAADVLLGASMTEGFGVPLIEAQACGCPVVTTDFAAMPELVRWGEAVAPADRFWSPLGGWWAWPSVAGVAAALGRLAADRERVGEGAWERARREVSAEVQGEFGWDGVVERYWGPLVERWAGVGG